MIVCGNLSGVQEFVFRIPQTGGEQAKRLRARSFYLQVLAEICLWRILLSVGGTKEHIRFCGASRFELVLDQPVDRAAIETQANAINAWLLENLHGTVRLVWAAIDSVPVAVSEDAISRQLHINKFQAWRNVAFENAQWSPQKLRTGFVKLDSDNRPHIAAKFFQDEVIGAELPNKEWLEISPNPLQGRDFAIAEWSIRLHGKEPPSPNEGSIYYPLSGLDKHSRPSTNPQVIADRPLARYVPREPNGSVTLFEELAKSSNGASYLGVLKMDVDGLGEAFSKRTGEEQRMLSARLDRFFSTDLGRAAEEKDSAGSKVYTVFSGGDDLLAVGPWDESFLWAAEVARRFEKEFGASKENLTISGGLTVVRWKFPVASAAQEAADLISLAKEAGGGQIAGMDNILTWDEAANALNQSKGLRELVRSGTLKRGWLQTILEFVEARLGKREWDNDAEGLTEEEKGSRRLGQELAASRLAYIVGRNIPKILRQEPNPTRAWADRLIKLFDRPQDRRLLCADFAIRHTLLSTRERS